MMQIVDNFLTDNLDKLSKTDKVNLTFKLIDVLKEARNGAVKSFLVMGRLLSIIKENNLYKNYGDHIEKFDDLLRDLRIGISTAYSCMAIWREFGEIITSKNLEIDYFRLVRLLPIAKEQENKEDWLYKAQELDAKGFDNEIRVAKGKVPTDECDCRGDRIFLMKCLICGKTRKVNEEELLLMLNKRNGENISENEGQ